MLKYLFLPLLLLTLGVSSVRAATGDPTGNVTAVQGDQVTMQVDGELPTWAKKGGFLKAINAEGKLVLRGGKITKIEGNVLTVNSTQAKDMKVGKVYKLAKARVNEGC